jgi:hypothetical protein
MNARQAQLRMLQIELHEQDFNGEQFLTWLLDFPDDPEDVGRVASEEAKRALSLAEGHYQQVTRTVAILRPDLIATVAFIQGATFAAAALGREPFSSRSPSSASDAP